MLISASSKPRRLTQTSKRGNSCPEPKMCLLALQAFVARHPLKQTTFVHHKAHLPPSDADSKAVAHYPQMSQLSLVIADGIDANLGP